MPQKANPAARTTDDWTDAEVMEAYHRSFDRAPDFGRRFLAIMERRERKRHERIMLWLTIAVTALTVVNVALVAWAVM